MGCDWSEQAKLVVSQYGASVEQSCPGQYYDILQASNFNPFEVWTITSIDFVQMVSFMLWVFAFIGFSVMAAAFVTYQSEAK